MFSKKYPSLLFQTVFLAITALQLIFVPNLFLKTFGFDATTEVWIKVLGVVILALAVLYYGLSQTNNPEILRWSIYARFTAGIGFTLLVLSGGAVINLLIFAILDMATAAFTAVELRKK